MTSRFVFVASISTLLAASGCPGDDSSAADTEAADGTGTTGSQTSGSPTTDPSATNSGDDSTTSGGTTEGVDDTTTGGEGSTTDEPPPPPTGSCIGIDQVGYIDNVFALDGMPIDDSCDPVRAPCGGDVVGSWDLNVTCGYDALPNPLEMDCPGSTVELEIVSESGSITFENDMTFTREYQADVQVTVGLDVMTCFGVDCATFEGFAQMEDPGTTCMDEMGSCTCVFPPAGDPPVMTSGTYELMGDTLVLDVGGETQELPYCVNGDRLDVWEDLYSFVDTMIPCNDEMDCVDELGDTHELYVCQEPMA